MQLEIQNVSKQYSRNTYALKELSITIEKGILGLLGPNGAGKSTLLKMIATVNRPTTGIIALNKNNIHKDANYMRKQLGFLPQDFGLYPNLNAYEFLSYLAAMKGVGGSDLNAKITQLLHGLNLINVAKKPIGSYSGGMKQRLGIAQALLNNPKVIIFDEPTVGLDPEERIRFRDLIHQLANDSIVILSSHIVSDIDTIADKVAIMKGGCLLAHERQEVLINSIKGNVYEIYIDRSELDDFKRKYLVIHSLLKEGRLLVRFISELVLPKATSVTATLEDAYLNITKTRTS